MHTVNWVWLIFEKYSYISCKTTLLISSLHFYLLATASNPSVGTVKNFIHLLDDSDLDFDQELSE